MRAKGIEEEKKTRGECKKAIPPIGLA